MILLNDAALKHKHVYAFMGSHGGDFVFNEHSPGVCKYCRLFAGFHSMSLEEYAGVSTDLLSGGPPRQYKFTNHVEFALVDLFFTVFLVQSKAEFLELTLNTVCRLLVSKKIDPRVAGCFMLYLDFLMEKHKDLVPLLVAVDFFEYVSDFLAEFMQNFELLSFKDSMSGKFEGNLEAMMRPSDRVEVKNIFAPYEGEEKQKKTLRLLGSKGTDEDVIDFKKKVIYNDCVWDGDKRRFRFLKIFLTPHNWELIREFNTDRDMGYFTYYFWRLHSMNHLLGIFGAVLARSKGKGRDGLFKRIGQLPLQVIEISVLFKDYSQFFVPREPFLVDSECWSEIRGMSSEFIVLSAHSGRAAAHPHGHDIQRQPAAAQDRLDLFEEQQVHRRTARHHGQAAEPLHLERPPQEPAHDR